MSLAHGSTANPGTGAYSRTLAVTIVRHWAVRVAANHRSCGPIVGPANAGSAHNYACARAVARPTTSSGNRSRIASTMLSASCGRPVGRRDGPCGTIP